MNGDDMLDRLFASSRASKPDTARYEHGFETRLMARMRSERSQPDLWSVWAWRLVPALAVFVLLLGLWNLAVPVANGAGTDPMAELAGNFEQEMLAYFTGD